MDPFADVKQRNQELAKRINHEARSDPHSPYVGKIVGMADGKVVIVGDDLTEVTEYLLQLGVDRERLCIVEASVDYDTPQHV